MGSWDFSDIALDISINYPSCTYDDWYDFYFLIPHPLALNLEICVLTHLLCGLLLDVVVTWYGHIYDNTPVGFFLLNYQVWLIAWDVSICDDWGVPQDGCKFILYYSFRFVLVPVLGFHCNVVMFTYVKVKLGSYLVVPVKVLICC